MRCETGKLLRRPFLRNTHEHCATPEKRSTMTM